MGPPYWTIVALYLAIGVGVLIANTRPHAQERALLKLATSVGVPLPERLGESIRRRLLRSQRGNVIGGMVGVAMSTTVIASGTLSESLLFGPLVMVGGALAGSAVGVSAAAMLSANRRPDDRPRYARAVVELNDYVSRAQRWFARVPVMVAVVSLCAGTVLVGWGWAEHADNWSAASSFVFVFIVVAALAVFEVAGRRIVAMGNHVGSLEELVWEDALRALALRDLAAAPAFLGLHGILLSNMGLSLSEPGPESRAISTVGVLLGLAAVVVAVGMLVTSLQRERHFLRRLWPELAADADDPRPVEATS